jgi:hypothetical protein
MRIQEQRWAYEVERRRLMLESTWNGNFVIIAFGTIVGFAVLFGIMFIYAAGQ